MSIQSGGISLDFFNGCPELYFGVNFILRTNQFPINFLSSGYTYVSMLLPYFETI